jgi:hypothetical protein
MLLKYIPRTNPNPDNIDSILPTVSFLLHDSIKEGRKVYSSRNKRCQILQNVALYSLQTRYMKLI